MLESTGAKLRISIVVILVALTLTFFGFPSVIREILQQSAAMR